tara:strand:- start:6391 stop:8421 length:2031 start_codon:yes stop_codon:yes gene_type:complete
MYATGDMVEMTESLEAGAPSIKYEGDKRPQTQMEGIEGQMAGPTWFFNRVENLEYLGYSPEEAAAIASNDEAYFEIVGDPLADGGQVRQKYGLGSFVKKIGRGIKKVVDNPIVQTALMMNPTTAPYAAAYSGLRSRNPVAALMAVQGMGNPYVVGGGIGNMNTNNMILRSVQNMGNIRGGGGSGDGSGGSSNIDQYDDNRGFLPQDGGSGGDSLFGKVRDALFYKKGTQELDPLKLALGAGASLLGISALQKRANEKQPKLEDMIGDRGSKIGLDDIQMKVQAAIDSGDKATYENLKVTENLAFLPPWESIQKAEGGRIGYASGGKPSTSIIEIMSVIETLPFDQKLRALEMLPPSVRAEVEERLGMAEGGRIGYSSGGKSSAEMLEIIQRLRAEGKTELEIQQILQQMFSVSSSGSSGIMNVPQRQSMLNEIIRPITEQTYMQSKPDDLRARISPISSETLDTSVTMLPTKGRMQRSDMSAFFKEPVVAPEILKRMQRSDMSNFFKEPVVAPEILKRMENMQFPTRTMETNMPQIDATGAAQGGRINKANGGLTTYEISSLKGLGYDTKGGTVLKPFGGLKVLRDILKVNNMAQGGIATMGNGRMMNMGGMEMDLRGGGFVPIGRAEKADDVPARLSRNEFVMTADAVKAAGDGDVDRGADKMYATMKQLEDRVA